ncbi:MAG: LexA family transcriptional regulator [Flavobacteriales bacterium]
MEKKIPLEAKRFKIIREENHFTQQRFAQFLNIGTSTIDIERGKTKISGHIVMQLLKNFNINPLWLFGKSFTKHLNHQGGDVSPKVVTIDNNEEETILLVNQKAAAGYPNNIQDIGWYKNLPVFNFPIPQYRNGTYRGFQVEGDSMIPNIQPNDWVLGRAVSNIVEASNNKIYIVVLKDSVLVKKIQKHLDDNKIRLISLNPNYLPIDVEIKDIQELWQVNSKLSFGINEPTNTGLLKQLQQSMEDLKGQIKDLKN